MTSGPTRGVCVATCSPEAMDAEDPLFILYTSGSTGKPKGVVHSQAGYMIYAAETFRHVFDYKPRWAKSAVASADIPDVHFCTADIGWITGHSYIAYGPLANGAHTLLFEGVPTYPDPGRLWEVRVWICLAHVPCLIGLLADMRQAQGHYILHCANCSARPYDSWKGARQSCRAQVVRACGGGIRVHPCCQRLFLAGYAYLGQLENPSIRRHGDGTTSTWGKASFQSWTPGTPPPFSTLRGACVSGSVRERDKCVGSGGKPRLVA